MELTQRNKKLLAGGTALALLAGIGGVLIGQSMVPPPTGETAPAEAGEYEGHGREGFVEMTPARLQSSDIRTTEVEAGSLASEIIAQATVAAPPEGEAVLTARADGTVVRISKRLGDPVRAGETVALLESRDAASFAADLNSAKARAQAARSTYAREKRLFEAKITARQDLEAAQAALSQAEAELERAQAAIGAANVTGNGRYLAVTSLISGRVTEVSTQLGAYVLAGAELFQVANPDRIQIEASVPSVDAQKIRPGDPAVIELPNGGTVDAVVRSATPSLDPESRTATLVLAPSATPPGLTQGQAVRARITPRGASTGGRIVLPEEAVQSVEGRDVVFVHVEGGFQAVPVTVGSRSGGRIEILEGLKPGLNVVTEGAFVLKSQLGASEAGH